MNIKPKAVSNFAEVIQEIADADKKARKAAAGQSASGSTSYLIKRVEDAPDRLPLIVVKGGGSFAKGDHIHREDDVICCREAQGFVSDIEEGAFPKRGILAEVDVVMLHKRLEHKRASASALEAEIAALEATLNKALAPTI